MEPYRDLGCTDLLGDRCTEEQIPEESRSAWCPHERRARRSASSSSSSGRRHPLRRWRAAPARWSYNRTRQSRPARPATERMANARRPRTFHASPDSPADHSKKQSDDYANGTHEDHPVMSETLFAESAEQAAISSARRSPRATPRCSVPSIAQAGAPSAAETSPLVRTGIPGRRRDRGCSAGRPSLMVRTALVSRNSGTGPWRGIFVRILEMSSKPGSRALGENSDAGSLMPTVG